ncbi:EMILIN-3 [Denticeps clupeoides]|uniref:EMILIN-3 n=1 Tax=Denticeps clupeoides TaxID=299321 RepID=UPI0010A499CC|nr:EMILIN-3-like [Denticeps clupeoides]
MLVLDRLYSLAIFIILLPLSSAFHYSLYKSGPSSHYNHGKPTSRYKNYCSYVVEKMVSFTMQDGVAPHVKAEYNRCPWHMKCPPLKYHLYYKPTYKVAHKTMTELEWRCCPGYSGMKCDTGPYAQLLPMQKGPLQKSPMPMQKGPVPMQKGPMPMQKSPLQKGPMPMQKGPMPMQKGPLQKGPMPMQKGPMPMQKGPLQKGPMPMQKGPMPMQKGPMPMQKGPIPMQKGPIPMYEIPRIPVQRPWHLEPQTNTNGENWGYHNGPQSEMTQSHFHQGDPVASFQLFPNHGYPEDIPEDHNPLPDQHDPVIDHHDATLDHEPPAHQDTVTDGYDSDPEHHEALSVNVETDLIHEDQTSSVASSANHDNEPYTEVTERLDRMEEDVQRLSRGLETLRGTVTSMEDGLRASLREDANRMISALLSASPGAAAHVATHDSAVGFGVLPGGPPHTEVLDGVQFSSLSELAGKVAELHNELQAKSAELVELRDTVLGHDGTLRQLTNQSKGIPKGPDRQKAVKMLLETKMNGTQAALLGNFVRRLESAERRCAERIGEVHSNCQKEQMDGQGHLQEALEQSTTDLRKDLLDLQAQLHAFGLDESCCNRMPHLLERVVLLEKSVSGLNESQIHLQAELGGHRDHVEGMIEGRLAYVEDKLNISSTEKGKQSVSALQDFMGVEARFEDKLKALEDRLFRAVGEIGNGSTPMLLEGQVIPSVEADVESSWRRMEVDVDRVQKQIRSLEVLCTSSCSSARMLRRDDDQLQASEGKEREEKQTEKLDYLNATLELLLRRLAEREDEEGGVLGAVTLLKLKVNTVNQTLWGLQNTLGAIEQEVGWANTTWQQREQRLAQQVKGVVQLVARQASMLGAGDRRLSRVKGELQELRKRLAGELHGCRTAALGVQKEVTEVGGRVARVEGQCEGMAQLAEDLERIRGELDRHSSEYLSQVNGTLVSHSLQLTELRDSLKNCTSSEMTKDAGDWQPVSTQHDIEVAPEPRGDQFTAPVHPKFRK